MKLIVIELQSDTAVSKLTSNISIFSTRNIDSLEKVALLFVETIHHTSGVHIGIDHSM